MRLIKPHHSGLQWVRLVLNIVSMQPHPYMFPYLAFKECFNYNNGLEIYVD
jgi:hypothetical protein